MKLFYFASIELGRPDAPNRHVLAVCNHLAARGHDIWLFAASPQAPTVKLHSRVSVVPVGAWRSGSFFLTTLSFYLMLPFYARKLFATQRPGVVYTRANFLEWIAMTPLQIFFDFLYVAEVNGIRSYETAGGALRRRLIAWQEQFSLGLADKIIAVTPELQQWVMETARLGGRRIRVIGNGVATDLFRPMATSEARALLGLDADVWYLTFVGSLKPWHDTETMLRAMPRIRAHLGDEVHLLVVGDGPGRRSVLELAGELGVGDSVHLIGSVKSERVPLYVNAADVCLAPFTVGVNRQTGKSPMKIYEYISCGRPFVATRVGTHFDDEFGGCDIGILVPPGDPISFANAVVQLLRDQDRQQRLGRRARQRAVERYSWAAVTREIEQFIRE